MVGPTPELRSFFPFQRGIRRVQVQALATIEQAHRASQRFVIIEAPTGSGKSAIAVSVARAFGGYILSPQKMLTQQYVRDFSALLVELRGRSNYYCRDYGTDCETGRGLKDREPKEKRDARCRFCPYRAQKQAFMGAQVGITNFDYFLLERMFAGELEPRTALIIDEGHNTEEAILKHVSLEFDCHWAERELGVVVPSLEPARNAATTIDWLRNELWPAAAKHGDACQERLQAEPQDRMLARQADEAAQFLRKIGFLLRQKDLTDWLFWTEGRGLFSRERFCAKPLSAAPFAERILFSAAEELVVILSATILDCRAFEQALGIRAADCRWLRLSCDFQLEHRPIFFIPVGRMRQRDRRQTLPALVETIRRILRRNAGHKGIIHTHSFENAQAITDYLARTEHSRRILTHKTSAEKEAILRQHAAQRGIPTVLVSPSMTEGLDLRDDLSRFQIIVKVPYGDLGNPYVAARKKRSERWYLWQTALKLVQATGRSVRSETDRASTYVLDADFRAFIRRVARILPRWWLDAIVWDVGEKKPSASAPGTGPGQARVATRK